MINQKELCKFLVEAKTSTYAAGDSAEKTKNSDNSTTITHKNGDWSYHDNYFGGEPYGGREVVFYKGKPVYMMTYYGKVEKTVLDINKVYGILMNALKLIPEDKPFRGPESFTEDNLEYKNSHKGEINDFHGEEQIVENGNIIYSARYAGGFVDM